MFVGLFGLTGCGKLRRRPPKTIYFLILSELAVPEKFAEKNVGGGGKFAGAHKE